MLPKEEVDAILSKVNEEAKKVIGDLQKELEQKCQDIFKGTATQEQMTEYKNLVEQKNNELMEILKAQGAKIAEFEKNTHSKHSDFETQLRKGLDEAKNAIKDMIRNKSGSVAIEIKAASPTATISGLSPGSGVASIVEQGSAAALLRLGDGQVYTIQRGIPFILNFVNVNTTTASAIMWFDEIAQDGDFAITTEGAIKPLVQYKFERRTSSYEKAAGRVIITEEFDQDFPRLVGQIKQLMNVDIQNELNDLVITDMIANASAYAYSGLDASVEDPDKFAAIGAALAQLQSLYYKPNILMINTADAWAMRLQKDNEGRYIMPPFTWNGETYEFGRVVADPRIPVGNFFVGDASVYHVDLKGGITIRIGYGGSTDDFIKNQFTMVAEQYFFSYISEAKKAGLIYADYDTIIADITTGTP